MKYFSLKLLCVLIFNISNAKIIHESSSVNIIELINSTKYSLIENIENGKRIERYYIDNKEVLSQEFIDSRVVSRVKELEIEARKSHEEREKKFKFSNDSKLKALKKLIFLKISEIKEAVSKIEKLNISSFFVYSQETFLNEEDFNSLKESLEDIDHMINSDQNLNLLDLGLIVDKLENRAKKSHLFVRQALENAINKCDDTKLLKDLLEVL
ncbi:MAG: hypothetical protein P4L22_05685 [Candidatus Babeliales bacterium]|nr:hypothetical protein [Candidatus Babeliales bacterium]